MANHCRLDPLVTTAMCGHIAGAVSGGAGAGAIVLYTGAEPAYADDAHGTEVATCVCADPAYAAAAADAVNHWSDSNLASSAVDADATGNAAAVTYFRLETSDGDPVLQGTVGTAGCDLNLNSTTIGAGAAVTITALEIRVPYNQA